MVEAATLSSAEPAAAPAPAPVAIPASASGGEGMMARLRAEIEARLRNHAPEMPTAALPNRIGDRYVIRVDTPLAEFSRGAVKTYAVGDASGQALPYYAAICDNSLPYRHTSMEKLLAYEHEHLIKLEARGITHISSLGEERHVLIFRRPQGKPLAQALKEGFAFNEQRLSEQLLAPLISILVAFDDMKISHCHIHPENLYLGERLVLGESISQPAGYSQDYLYEPIERLSASPQGKGGGSIKVDTYALGVLVVEMLHGLGKLRALSREQLTTALLTNGSYNVIAANGEYSEHYQDLLRGTLSDNPHERWGITQLTQWLTGKRFNIIHPSTPRESSRPFSFEGKDYFNRKALAHALFSQWDKARNFIRTSKLDRWMEQSLQEPDTADLLVSAVNSTGGPTSKNQKRNNELLSRSLAVIDPSGPLRCEHMAFNVDAMGKMLCDAIYHKKQADLNILIEMIQSDLPHYWSERQNGKVTTEVQEALWKLQNVRVALQSQSFGFGIERCLYDLNLDLPCYSQEVKGHYITDLKTLLRTLDSLAAAKPNEFSLLDRHLAAFIASKTGATREVRFQEIAAYAPDIAASNELKIISILGRAQEKANAGALRGLSYYCALRILSMLDAIHSRNIRDALAAKIRSAAEDGLITTIIAALLDTAILERDQQGFTKAKEMFQRNAAMMSQLRDRDLLRKNTQERGKRWASLLSIVVLMLIGGVVILNHFR